MAIPIVCVKYLHLDSECRRLKCTGTFWKQPCMVDYPCFKQYDIRSEIAFVPKRDISGAIIDTVVIRDRRDKS